MSQLKVNSIVDASGGSNAQLYGVASPPNSMGFRNRILNGDCRIDQRNAGASVTGNSGVYPVDRWSFNNSQSSKFTAQRNAGSVTPPAGFTNYLGVTSSSAYSLLSGDYFGIGQNIEGFNVADLGYGAAGAQTITLSFWVRSSLTGTFSLALVNSAFARGYVTTYTISAANTWEYKTVTIAGDTTGTWLTDNGVGLRLYFNLGAGSGQNVTPNTWGAWGGWGVSGAVNVVSTSGATFYITGVQLEAGTVASPFERRDYGRELIMCQRYCYVQGGNSNGYPPFASGQIRSSTTALFYKAHPVAMRAAPSVSINSASNFIVDDAAGYVPTALTLDRYTDGGMMLAATTSSGPTAGRGAVLYGDAAGNARITVTSEL